MTKIFNDEKLFIFFTIDLLFFPYFPLFVIPISLPFVLIKLFVELFSSKINFNKKETLVYVLFFSLVILSALLSFFGNIKVIDNQTVLTENVKRAFQLITSFAYYFYYRNSYINEKTKNHLKQVFSLFLFLYVILGLLTYVDVGIYFKYLELLGIDNPFVNPWYLKQQDYLFRYSYIWIDPNNSAYIVQVICIFMLSFFKNKYLENITIYLAMILSVIFSMSTGALLSFILLNFFMAFNIFKKLFRLKTTIKQLVFNYFFTIFAAIMVSIIVFYVIQIFGNTIFYSLERMTGNTDGGRLAKYTYLFEKNVPNLIGEGYVLIRDGQVFRPHSDHLRFLYSYGIIAYFLALYIFFYNFIKDQSNYLFLIPAALCFTTNSLIDEQKILSIFLVILGIAYNQNMLKGAQYQNEGS